METNFEQILSKVAEELKGMATTNTIIGEEFKMGEYTCKPVIRVGLGFGSGQGEGDQPRHKGKGNGVGAAGGVGISPVGFLVTKGDEISFVPADQRKGLQAILDKVPDLMEKIIDMKKKKEEEEEKETKKK